jgi:hypothetical protein
LTREFIGRLLRGVDFHLRSHHDIQ